jgi:hypothetical protein
MPPSRNGRGTKAIAAPNPRKKARTAKPVRAGVGRKRATSAAKKALSLERRPGAAVPVAPTFQVRKEAFLAAWAAHLVNLQVVETFAVGDVAVAVAARRGQRPHWVYITTGLWARGVELCLKVPQLPEEPTPPAWASDTFRTLVGIAASPEGPSLTDAQVLTLGMPFAPGSEMTSVAFVDESTLGAVVTPYDSVKPLLAVGLTRDEERIVREWSPKALLEVLAQADPLLATDLERSSLLLSPRARTHIEQRVEREGSSMSVMWANRSSLAVQPGGSTWSLSADAVETFVSLLKGRVGHHRGFAVHSAGSATVDVQPADRPSLVAAGGSNRIELSQPAARQLRAVLRPKEGRYTIDSLPELTIEVVV